MNSAFTLRVVATKFSCYAWFLKQETGGGGLIRRKDASVEPKMTKVPSALIRIYKI